MAIKNWAKRIKKSLFASQKQLGPNRGRTARIKADIKGVSLFSVRVACRRRIAYELKEELRDIYETTTTVKTGLRKFKKWLISAQVIFGKTASTLCHNLKDICHYFVQGTTNGMMEGLNNKIKLILRALLWLQKF